MRVRLRPIEIANEVLDTGDASTILSPRMPVFASVQRTGCVASTEWVDTNRLLERGEVTVVRAKVQQFAAGPAAHFRPS